MGLEYRCAIQCTRIYFQTQRNLIDKHIFSNSDWSFFVDCASTNVLIASYFDEFLHSFVDFLVKYYEINESFLFFDFFFWNKTYSLRIDSRVLKRFDCLLKVKDDVNSSSESCFSTWNWIFYWTRMECVYF